MASTRTKKKKERNNRDSYLLEKKRGRKFFSSGRSVDFLHQSGAIVDPTGGFFDADDDEADEYEPRPQKYLCMAEDKIDAAISRMIDTRVKMEAGKRPSISKQKGFWRYRSKKCSSSSIAAEDKHRLYKLNNIVDPLSDSLHVDNIAQVLMVIAKSGATFPYHTAQSGAIFAQDTELVTKSCCYKDFEASLNAELVFGRTKLYQSLLETISTRCGFVQVSGQTDSRNEKNRQVAEIIAFVSSPQAYCMCIAVSPSPPHSYRTHFYAQNTIQ